MASQQKQSRPKRYQYFTFLIYPDSAPKNYIEILRETHIPMYLSTHDCDTNFGDDEEKKTHIHVMVGFDSLKNPDACDAMIEAVNGVKPPMNIFLVQSKRGMARYLLHMDNPEKYPYYKDHTVLQLNGIEDYDALCKSNAETENDIQTMMDDIEDYFEKKEIYNYAAMVKLARRTGNREWTKTLRTHTYHFYAWCESHNDPNLRVGMDKVDDILEKLEGDTDNESNN